MAKRCRENEYYKYGSATAIKLVVIMSQFNLRVPFTKIMTDK